MGFHNSGGGGGIVQYTETTLWTNASPTANFSATSITLSDDVENYDFIKIIWCRGKGYTSSLNSCLVQIPWTNGDNTHLNMQGRNSSSASFTTRNINALSGNTITLGAAGGQADNGSCIPLQVIGINKIKTVKAELSATLVVNNAPASSYTVKEGMIYVFGTGATGGNYTLSFNGGTVIAEGAHSGYGHMYAVKATSTTLTVSSSGTQNICGMAITI